MRKSKNVWDEKRGLFHPRISEEHVVKEIITMLAFHQICVYRVRERIPVAGKRWQTLSTPGIPDLVGWVPDRKNIERPGCAIPLFIECKRPGGVHRVAQSEFIEQAREDGCAAFFAESWEDVVRELLEYGIPIR